MELLKKIGVFFVFALILACSAETVETLNFDFTRINSRASGNDTTKGTVYQFENRMFVKVTAPINQIMVIDSGSTLIYNPGERSAIQFHSKNPASMPLFQVFLKFFQGTQILPPPFLKLGKTEKKGDSLCISWVPDSKKKSPFGKFETIHYKDKPLVAGLYDTKGNCLSMLRFSQDSLINGHHVPLNISSQTWQKTDTIIENILFYNLAQGKNIPAEILNFKIPSEIPIKVLEW